MVIKGVKPQTHFKIDLTLFMLLLIVASTGWLQNSLGGPGMHHLLPVHVLHVLAGTTMCVVVTVHLIMHIPWIKSQWVRLTKSTVPEK